MDTTDDTTSTGQPGNQTAQHVSAETPPGGSNPPSNKPPLTRPAWEQAIEAERSQLLQARSVLACLYEVLLHADGEEAVTYAETAYVAGQMIEDSVERLDLVRIRPLVEAAKRGGRNPRACDDERFGPNAVRDEPVTYLA